MENIPESIRKHIDHMIDKATVGIPINSTIKQMMVSICFEMYKAGFKDAHRIIEKSIELSKDMLTK